MFARQATLGKDVRGEPSSGSLHVGFTRVYFATHSTLLASAVLPGTSAILSPGGEAAGPATATAMATPAIPKLEVIVAAAMPSSTLDWFAVAIICLCSPSVCKSTLEPGDTNTDEHCQGQWPCAPKKDA